MPSRLIASVLSLVLLWSGLSTHESFNAQLLVTQAGVHALAIDGDASPVDEAGTVEDHHLDDLPSFADVAEHAVMPAVLNVGGTMLTTSLSRRHGMADVASARIDGLLRPPRTLPVTG